MMLHYYHDMLHGLFNEFFRGSRSFASQLALHPASSTVGKAPWGSIAMGTCNHLGDSPVRLLTSCIQLLDF